MVRLSAPFGGGGDDELFDPWDEFVPAHLPEPGPFLDDHDVLGGDAHLAVHRLSRELFEERGVYDMTFGYNLARLNLDTRHPEAGFRYGVDPDDPGVLRAEFTPTTQFCPQSHTLTTGAYRAWNGLADRHEYVRVEVAVHPMHQRAVAINDDLATMAERFAESGYVGPAPPDDETANGDGGGDGEATRTGRPPRYRGGRL